MITILKKRIMPTLFGLSLLGLGAASCGTLTGATLGGAAGAGCLPGHGGGERAGQRVNLSGGDDHRDQHRHRCRR